MCKSLTRKNIKGLSLEEIYRKALEHYFGSIIIVDNDANILFANHGSEEMLKYPKDKLIEMSMYEVIEKGLVDTSVALEVLQTKCATLKYIKTGEGVGMFIASQPVLDTEGEIELVCTYSQEESFANRFLRKMENDKQSLYQAIDYLTSNSDKNDMIQTKSGPMKKIFSYAHKVSVSDATVMLYGESGTGKEVLARYIYRNSNRRTQMFLPINCATIPLGLMEAELFGYEKGSFTGANKDGQMGLFEIADGGTIFLDELGEMPLALQSKLLRILETGEFRRVGGNKIIHTDVRLIAATNRELLKMVEEKTFREDLYYRLNVIPIKLPPLRERKEDVLSLAENFLEQYNKKYGTSKFFTGETIDAMMKYEWPGNVRELKNTVERMVITSTLDSLILDETMGILAKVREIKNNVSNEPRQIIYENIKYDKTLKDAAEEFEEQYITNVLKQCNGNVTMAAKRLGIHRSGLYRKLDNLKKR